MQLSCLARLCSFSVAGAVLAVSPLPAADHAPNPTPPGVKAIEAPGLHNLFALGTNVFSGSSPETDHAFAALAKLGVKTIITVDGARPDIEAARRHGLRYVHLPHGYDGISATVQHQLARAAEALPGPIYVHCHHGKHRGPAAAAIICMAGYGWTPAEAESWLVAAGTATTYGGLYGAVRTFAKPTAEQMCAVPGNFPRRRKFRGWRKAWWRSMSGGNI